MSMIVLQAEPKTQVGTAPSRRLRRLEGRVPGIVYGGGLESESIHVSQKDLLQALEDEKIFATVFDLMIGEKTTHVLLKDIQRHPYKKTVLHFDLQRVSSKDVVTRKIALRFLNESSSKGVKMGGQIHHLLSDIEVRCRVQDLPEWIEVDLIDVNLNQTLHLSDLPLPTAVQLTNSVKDSDQNLPVVSIQAPKNELS